MESSLDLTGITLIAVAATLIGMLMVRMRQPAAIGYIIAGILLGSLGLIDGQEARQYIFYLAEMGVILLLYFIGMELSVRNLKHIWRISLITLIGQIFFSVAISISLGQIFGWDTPTVLLFGFCLALSSTAVAVKTLENCNEINSHAGRLTIGILIAQDLAVAPMLLIISGFKGDAISTIAFVRVVFEVSLAIAILGGVIYGLTRKKELNLPLHGAWLKKPELTSLWALSFCFLLASICGMLDLTPAFGAFLAGLIVGNSAQHTQIHRNTVPIQSVLLMVFFLSIGLLVDLQYIAQNFGLLIILWGLVVVFKTMLNVALLKIQGEAWQNSFRCSLMLGQMGEFSFVLAAAALASNIIAPEIHKLIVALTVISLISTPIYNDAVNRLGHRATKRITNPKGILKLIYTPERRITKIASKQIYRTIIKLFKSHRNTPKNAEK